MALNIWLILVAVLRSKMVVKPCGRRLYLMETYARQQAHAHTYGIILHTVIEIFFHVKQQLQSPAESTLGSAEAAWREQQSSPVPIWNFDFSTLPSVQSLRPSKASFFFFSCFSKSLFCSRKTFSCSIWDVPIEIFNKRSTFPISNPSFGSITTS